MANGKNKIIFYKDWWSTFEDLSDEEAGRLIKHFCAYINDEEPEAPDRLTALLFKPIQQTLKRDLKKWEKRCEINRKNGSKGGQSKASNSETKQTLANASERPPNLADSDSDSDSDNDSDRYKKEVFDLFQFSLDLFPDKAHPKTEKQKNDWLDTLEKCNRIDGYTWREIYDLIKWGREHHFWHKVFLSVNKLRKKNDDGLKYIDVFALNYNEKNSQNGKSRAQQRKQRNAEALARSLNNEGKG